MQIKQEDLVQVEHSEEFLLKCKEQVGTSPAEEYVLFSLVQYI